MATKRAATTPTRAASKAKAAPTVKATGAKAPATTKKPAAPAAKATTTKHSAAKVTTKPTAVPSSTTKATTATRTTKATTATKVAPAPAKAAKSPSSTPPPAKSTSPTKRAVSTTTPTPSTSAAAKKAAVVKKSATSANGSQAPKAAPAGGPYASDEKFLEEQRVLLIEEHAVYQGQAEDLRAEADSLAQEREPGDVQFDEESGEGGTVAVDRERDLALSAQALAAVEEIDDALHRIDRKTYGACERCREAIPKARLKALPYARLCVACKSGGLSRR